MGTSSLAPLGRRAFIAGTAGAIAATAVTSVAEAAVPAGASYFEAVDPVRLADTRNFAPYTNVAKNFFRSADGRLSRINIRNSPYASVPSDAVAVVLSIGAIYSGVKGWVKAVPSGSASVVSNINMENGDRAVANLATVKIGADGKIDVISLAPTNVVVDIVGIYRSTSVPVRSGRIKFLPTTRRALANRRMAPRSWHTVPLSFVPSNAQAVVVNLTIARGKQPGFLTALSARTSGEPPVSNVNYGAGEARAAGAIVKLPLTGTTPSIELYASSDVYAYVDVTGYITGVGDPASDEGLFVPINPFRVMDTRRAADFARTKKKRLWPNWSREFALPSSSNGFGTRSQMAGVAFNATVVNAMQRGHVTVLPARTQRQDVSNVNAGRPGQIVANHVISEVTNSGVELFAVCGGDMVADVAGWYTGRPKPATYSKVTLDPPAPPAPFNWRLNVPRMGLLNTVIPNAISGDPVVNSGNTWHWTNTGLLGNGGAAIVVFGHRTSHGGPYRRQHDLVSGDALYLETPDQRAYTYKFVGERITDWRPENILNGARANSAGTTITLVSCTGRGTQQSAGLKNDQPTGGVHWRLVSTFVLVDWIDIRPNLG